MKECVAVGSGGAYQVGDVATRVLYGFAVPVDEEMVFGVHATRTVYLSFSGFQ